jgi:excinuclease UvrABC ATPase subunit
MFPKGEKNWLQFHFQVFGFWEILLSFYTIYAEGQRRYVETFSADARQFWVV